VYFARPTIAIAKIRDYSQSRKNTTKKPPMTLTSGKDFVRPSEKYESWNTFQQPIPKSSCAMFYGCENRKMAEFTNQLPCPRSKETFKDTLRTKIPH